MKNILLVCLTLFYAFGLFAGNSFEKDKSYSAYCGKFLSAKPVSKSAGANQGVEVLSVFKFLVEGEDSALVKSLGDFQYHPFSNRFSTLKPRITAIYVSFLHTIPDSLPSATPFIPS